MEGYYGLYVGIHYNGRIIPATGDKAHFFTHTYEGGQYRGWVIGEDVWDNVIAVRRVICQAIQVLGDESHIFFVVQCRRNVVRRIRPLRLLTDLRVLINQGRFRVVQIYVDNAWYTDLIVDNVPPQPFYSSVSSTASC